MNFFVVFSPDQEKPEIGKVVELNSKSSPFYLFYPSLEKAVEHIRYCHTEYRVKDTNQQYWIASGSISEEDAVSCISAAVLSGDSQRISFTPTSLSFFSNGCCFSPKPVETNSEVEYFGSDQPYHLTKEEHDEWIQRLGEPS